MPNVFSDDWDVEQSEPGFSWKRMRLAGRLGGEKLGASVYELPPGERSFPYHLHHANEEMLVVLDGEVMSQAGFDGDLEARIPPGGREPIKPCHERGSTPKSCWSAAPGWSSSPA
ncbi:MAG TPA: hypothetical protein VFY04_08785, partial [Solirubrobacterales bacterium]|nr:hypothetical protein [Solirubrobacterales bacterium]